MSRTQLRRLAAVPVAAAMTLTGCAQPEPEVSQDLDFAIAEPAEVIVDDAPSDAAPTAASTEDVAGQDGGDPGEAAPSDSGTGGDQEGTSGSSGGSGGGTAATPPRPAKVTTLLDLSDRRDDNGLAGRDDADLVGLVVRSIGTNELSVTITVDAPFPATPPAGDVYLVGVDLLENDEGESEYQLFVTGNGDGWYAHLYVEEYDGFVAFPGSFTIDGASMTLTVPWQSVGSPTRGPVRARVEWSRDQGTSVLLGLDNPNSDDRLDGQPHQFDRNP